MTLKHAQIVLFVLGVFVVLTGEILSGLILCGIAFVLGKVLNE